jgi:hypothetical protein
VSWTPGDGYHSDPEQISISLNFSHEPNRASVERSFSLTGDGNRIRGNFIWNERNVIFSPLTSLEINTDYIISLSADAFDTGGLNMDDAFYAAFSTRVSNNRPVLISFFPEMYAEIDDPRTEVSLQFSMPVTLRTLYDNVSFNPSMTGLWRLEDEGRLAIFTPAQPWTHNNRYEMRFSTSLIADNGMNIGNSFLSVFTVGIDREPPYLVNARRITKDGEAFDLLPSDNFSENQNWEKNDKLLLVFSKPVDSMTVRNNLSVEGGPGSAAPGSFVMETSLGFHSEIVFRFDNAPVFESRFTFRIKPGIRDSFGNDSTEEYYYRVVANGKFSRPPVLAGLRMPMVPGNVENPNLVFFGTDSLFQIIPITDKNYPSGESIRTWIELYFITAEGASVDVFSLMELFRIDTSNNVISFSPRQVINTGFTISDPHNGWENYQRIEISGNLINSTNFGLINFQIASGLRDSLGNRNENIQIISLTK